jgi:hypothetical protein
MQLSQATIEILQQFSTINESIKIEPGNVLRTMDKARAIYASATVAEDFPNTVSIASIREFLALYDLFEEPKLTFTSKCVEIRQDDEHAQYWFADPSAFKPIPTGVKKGEFAANPKITKAQLQTLLRAAYTLKVPELHFYSDSDGVQVKAVNTQLSSSNFFNLVLDPARPEKKIDVRLSLDRCKLLPRDYTIGLGSALPAVYWETEGLEYAMAASA